MIHPEENKTGKGGREKEGGGGRRRAWGAPTTLTGHLERLQGRGRACPKAQESEDREAGPGEGGAQTLPGAASCTQCGPRAMTCEHRAGVMPYPFPQPPPPAEP